jgi:hypothetical protein
LKFIRVRNSLLNEDLFADSTLDSLVASRQAELSTVMATYSTVSTRLQRY